MIRKASQEDICGIMTVVEESRQIMQADGNFQWDESYPLQRHFESDINEGTLYIIDKDGVVAGVICLNRDEPQEYSSASWQSTGKSLVIHRMAVSPKFRGNGFAGILLDFAHAHACENKARSLRTDTFSKNIPMNTLFLKHGFKKSGVIELKGKRQQPFYCYEKLLRENSEI